ncbi:MAG: twin-arginine translocation signal domain-containing protein [Deltaproteobacteria bacterium]|nr:twin-arginine translocation signal domain-containing protein [Deltaproteobacteria bacterium]
MAKQGNAHETTRVPGTSATPETPRLKETSSIVMVDRRQFLGGATALGVATATGLWLPGCGAITPAPTTGPGPNSAKSTPTSPASGTHNALEAFGVTETQARKVLARALQSGGDFADLFFERSRLNYLGLEDSAVNRAYSQVELGLGVRVVRGLETGYAYTESLDLASMLQAAAVAAAVAAGPRREAPQAFAVGKAPSYYPVQTAWKGVKTQDKVAMLMKLHGLIDKRDKRIKKINLSYRDEAHEIAVVNSDGHIFADSQPMAVCYASCLAEQKGKRESNYSAIAGRAGLEFFSDARLQKVARQVVDRTTVLFEAVPGPVGELPVVLGPGSSGILLHEAIGHGMEADFARKNTTIFADQIGKKIAENFVTIIDDGTQPGLRGSINGDDEGNTSARTTLVENGVLRTFMHDRISAKHFGLAPTGNGRRQSFRHMPIPRMRNTYMLGGPHEREEIIQSVKRGIYAEHFTNGQVKIGPGNYSFYVKNGMLIENGKLTRPIKDINIIGNGPESLRRMTMVAKDFALDEGGWTCGKRGQRVPVGLGMPTVKVSAITIGGTGKGHPKKKRRRRRRKG